jgi:hypothetical protein
VRDRVRLVILLMIFHATHARWMTILAPSRRGDGGDDADLPAAVIPIWSG